MIYKIVAMRDAVSEEYIYFHEESDERVAIRNFESSIRAAKAAGSGLLCTHPEDYDLYHIGTFDSEAGSFTNTDHKLLKKGSEC